jgi:hypothetical protein
MQVSAIYRGVPWNRMADLMSAFSYPPPDGGGPHWKALNRPGQSVFHVTKHRRLPQSRLPRRCARPVRGRTKPGAPASHRQSRKTRTSIGEPICSISLSGRKQPGHDSTRRWSPLNVRTGHRTPRCSFACTLVSTGVGDHQIHFALDQCVEDRGVSLPLDDRRLLEMSPVEAFVGSFQIEGHVHPGLIDRRKGFIFRFVPAMRDLSWTPDLGPLAKV